MEKKTVTVVIITLSIGVLLFSAITWSQLSKQQTITAIVSVLPQNSVPLEKTAGPVAGITDPIASITDPSTAGPVAVITEPSSAGPVAVITDPSLAGPVAVITDPSTAGPVAVITEPSSAEPVASITDATGSAGSIAVTTDTSTAGSVAVITDPSSAGPIAVTTESSTAGPIAFITDPGSAGSVTAITDISTAGPVAAITDPISAGPVAAITDPSSAGPAAVITDPSSAGPVAVITDHSSAGPIAVITDPRTAGPVAVNTDPSTAGPVAAITDPNQSEVRTDEIKRPISNHANKKQKPSKGQITDEIENGLEGIGDNRQMILGKTAVKKRKQGKNYVRYLSESLGEADLIANIAVDDTNRSSDTSGGYRPSLDKEKSNEDLITEQGGMLNRSLGRSQQEQYPKDSYRVGSYRKIRKTIRTGKDGPLGWFLLRKKEANSFLYPSRRRKRTSCTFPQSRHRTPELDCDPNCYYEELHEYDRCFESFDISDFAHSYMCRRNCGANQGCYSSRTVDFYTLSQVETTCFIAGDDERNPAATLVNGGIGQWNAWRPCSVTCGNGTQVRYRRCTSPLPLNGGTICTENRTTERECTLLSCQVHGGWGSWNPWMTCSKTCGGGEKSRTRNCNNPAPSHGGSDCVGVNNETSTCNNHHCPVHGTWGSWNSWLTCSKTCGGGEKSRTRNCDNPAPSHGGSECVGVNNETSTCNAHHCQVHGAWGSWNRWLACSKTCGGGERYRTRICNDPAPSHGGGDCVGVNNETSTCSHHHCPVHGAWGSWNPWFTCSKTCGGGEKSRTRNCDNPTPGHGGSDCVGVNNETSTCNAHHCQVHGAWGSWNPWFTCSKTCGGGEKSRTRNCDNPAPGHGGSDCVGVNNETSTCNDHHCQVNGGWGTWISMSVCSVTCGVGTRQRYRTCDSPAPSDGGSGCVGHKVETETCNTHNCPGDGGWGSWNPWLTCSKTCGGGEKTRSRSCDNPGGSDCVGVNNETLTCNNHHCPAEGEWASWLTWSACSVINNNAMRTRCRKCNNTTPHYNGSSCLGSHLESDQCKMLTGRVRSGCRCRCSKLGVNINVSAAEIKAMMIKTRKELTVDKKQTSIAVRKKISSSDPRTSSHYIGGLGIMMLVCPLLFLVSLDLLNVLHFFR